MTTTVDGVTAPAVAAVLAAAWGRPAVVVDTVRQLSAGASRLSYAVDARVDGELRPLVLQRERTAGLGRSEVETESRLLRAAAAAGVPVPAVVAADTDGGGLGGAYVVTTRIEGETIPRRILRTPELAPARERFAAQCGAILAAVHAIPLERVEPLPVARPVDDVTAMLDGTGQARPAFELGLAWLRDNPPPAGDRAVVHGDFRNGNLIVGPEGIRAVLDWELAHAGDPAEDLGWLCARAWRWGAEPVVGGMGTVADLLTAYHAAGGAEVSEERLWWWRVLATVKWGVMCLEQARTHLSGESRSVELAVLGRLAAEVEYDLLRMVRA